MNHNDAVNAIEKYCKQTIPNYRAKARIALDTMDRERCSIESADYSLASDIYDAIDTWCTDNNCPALVDDITELDIILNN